VGVVNSEVIAGVLRTMTEKVLFLGKKSAPPEEILATPMMQSLSSTKVDFQVVWLSRQVTNTNRSDSQVWSICIFNKHCTKAHLE